MESLYILIPLSVVLVLLILGIFGWALHRGQFEDIEAEGQRILTDEPPALDDDQARQSRQPEQSRVRSDS